MVLSSQQDSEVQTLIYRGCARLAEAMQVKRIAKGAEQKWEDGALREANEIFDAAVKGSLTDLTIPPLPLAILEVHKRLEQRRPMNPSDVSSPFDQASTSPLALWMTDENDPDIPSHIDLGDPATFWWKDVEVTPGRVRTTYGMNAEDNHALGPRAECAARNYLPKRQERDPAKRRGSISAGETDESESELEEFAQIWRVAAKRPQTDVDEPRDSGPSKRYRTELSSEESGSEPDDEYRYFYDPECENCQDRGMRCHVVPLEFVRHGQQWGQCTPCKLGKKRCSAIQDKYRVIKRPGGASSIDGRNKPESIITRLRPRRVESTHTPHSSTSNAYARPIEQLATSASGIEWVWQKRADRAATAPRSPSHLSESQAPGRSKTPSMTGTSAASSASTTTGTPTTSEPESAMEVRTPKQLVDKCVATESQSLDQQLGHREVEFMRGLILLILEVVQAHQSRQSISRTDPQAASVDGPRKCTCYRRRDPEN